MGRKKVTIEQLVAEVDKILEDYGDDVQTAVEKTTVNYAKIGVRMLKESSPVGPGPQSGRYAKGWAYKRSGEGTKTSAIIHNKTDYQLTHLLENGHALRQGGRSPAVVHIAPVEDKVCRDYVDVTIREIKA